MELVCTLFVSFGVALTVGYISVLFQHSSEKVCESEAGKKISQWLFLLPVISFVERWANAAFTKLESIKVKPFVGRISEGFLLSLISIVMFVTIICVAGFLLFWLLGFIIANYLLEILGFSLIVAIGLYLLRTR